MSTIEFDYDRDADTLPEGDLLDDDECIGFPSPEIDAFLKTIARACAEKPQAVLEIGGNILIHLPDAGTWTLVTKGPDVGLHDGATDDVVDFALICDEFVLFTMLDPDPPPNLNDKLETYAEEGYLRMEGDARMFSQLLALAEPNHNALSVRFAAV